MLLASSTIVSVCPDHVFFSDSIRKLTQPLNRSYRCLLKLRPPTFVFIQRTK